MEGHVGIYIGNGKVIEARGHAYGVVETNLVGRGWTSWGQLDLLDYNSKEFADGDEKEALQYLISNGRISNGDYWCKTLEVVKDQKWAIIKWANDVQKLLQKS